MYKNKWYCLNNTQYSHFIRSLILFDSIKRLFHAFGNIFCWFRIIEKIIFIFFDLSVLFLLSLKNWTKCHVSAVNFSFLSRTNKFIFTRSNFEKRKKHCLNEIIQKYKSPLEPCLTLFHFKTLKMSDNILPKNANLNNPLAQQLLAARKGMQQRLLIEANKPHYKVSPILCYWVVNFEEIEY